ncbi:MAG: cation diffusion facilitator family transporter [Candidatus Saganbacteria bacterium]|nr:cation diffusion facilitator family transporter [Candidatus Saganbacteria bacterium]
MNTGVHTKEKQSVALLSVFAAVFLTSSKLVIGLLTGSLGIISEALHSGLDLVAAVVTYFSVRISDKPADHDHQYGHGKIENLSAFIETVLLLITCGWIIYEASHRLLTGRFHIEVTVWSFAVILTSILIDYSRSKALSRTAKKYNSQALEADALHFSTDIWSSLVVLFGLVCVKLGIFAADSIAALFVAGVVVMVAFRIGRRAIDVLVDKAPEDAIETVEKILKKMHGIHSYHDIKIRNAGPDTFVEINIHVNPKMSIEQAHNISEKLERTIKHKIDRCSVHIHEEPEDRES